MIITVSGPPGSGTTTVAEALSSRYDLDHVSSGDVFRSMADERGMSLAEFGTAAEEDPKIDREIDDRQRDIALDRDDLVLEGRLSGWMAEDADPDLRVWLDAPIGVRAARVSEREGQDEDEARAEIEEREASEAKRYREIHGIDIDDFSVYDLVVDTSTWDEEAVVTLVETAVDTLE